MREDVQANVEIGMYVLASNLVENVILILKTNTFWGKVKIVSVFFDNIKENYCENIELQEDFSKV